jgi:hypothetical protein
VGRQVAVVRGGNADLVSMTYDSVPGRIRTCVGRHEGRPSPKPLDDGDPITKVLHTLCVSANASVANSSTRGPADVTRFSLL